MYQDEGNGGRIDDIFVRETVGIHLFDFTGSGEADMIVDGGSSEFAPGILAPAITGGLFFYRASCALRGRVNTIQFSGMLANTLPQRMSKSTLPGSVLSITNLRNVSPRSPSCALSRNGSDASSAAQAAS
jgi:hypothetical protein